MRYEKEVAWKFFGDTQKAQQHIPQARTVIGELLAANQNNLPQLTRRVPLAPGVECDVHYNHGIVIAEISAVTRLIPEGQGKVQGFILLSSDGKEGILGRTATGWAWTPKSMLSELAYGCVVTWMDAERVITCDGTAERHCTPDVPWGGSISSEARVFLNGRLIEDLPTLRVYLGGSFVDSTLYIVGLDALQNLVVCSKFGNSWSTNIVYSTANFYGAWSCALFDSTGRKARVLLEADTPRGAGRVVQVDVSGSASVIHTDEVDTKLLVKDEFTDIVLCSITEDGGTSNSVYDPGTKCTTTTGTGASMERVYSHSNEDYSFPFYDTYFVSGSNIVYAFSENEVYTIGTTDIRDYRYDYNVYSQTVILEPGSYTKVTGTECQNKSCDSVDGTKTYTEPINEGETHRYTSQTVWSDHFGLIGRRQEEYGGMNYPADTEYGYMVNYCGAKTEYFGKLCQNEEWWQWHTQESQVIWGFDPRCGARLYTKCTYFWKNYVRYDDWVDPYPMGFGTTEVWLTLPSGVDVLLETIDLAIAYFCINAYVGMYNNTLDPPGTGTDTSCRTLDTAYVENCSSCHLFYDYYDYRLDSQSADDCENQPVSHSAGQGDAWYSDENRTWGFIPRLREQTYYTDMGFVSAETFQGNGDVFDVVFQCNQDTEGRWLISVYMKFKEYQICSKADYRADSDNYIQLRDVPPIYVTRTVMTGFEGDPTSLIGVVPVPDEEDPEHNVPPHFKKISVTGPRTL